jgi:phospholipase A1
MKTYAKSALLSSLFLAPALSYAQTAAPVAAPTVANEVAQQMLRCSVIGDASARLGCFDELSKAAAKAPLQAPATTELASGATVPSAAANAVPAVADGGKAPPEAAISRTVQRWELDSASKRGRFVFRPLRDNYLLLANYSSSSNTQPYQEFTPAGLNTQRTELTYQLSFKMKLLEAIQNSQVDLWFGYTQQSFWQAYNRKESSPFRETNYQPELIVTVPILKSLGGFDIRYANFGVVHQSNGQTSTLSRSWNRAYGELGVDYGDLSLAARIWKRLDNGKSDNDNPDITDFLGNGDVRLSYRHNGHELAVTARRNFHTDHGSMQASWAFPVASNLKGYLQLFSGYGESLIDYNYSQKSVGAGFLVDF